MTNIAMERSTMSHRKAHEISMAMFNSYATNYQMVTSKL